MMKKRVMILSTVILFAAGLAAGCSRGMLGGAAVGAAGAGAAYEYQNKKQMDQLEADYKAGRIDKDEYFRRKQQIESGSLIY
jgi:osmotically-inducible protein OsmY